MNNVVLIGRLAKDPDLRYTVTGKAVANMTVAVNRGYGKDNEADFIPVIAWEKTAENCANYLTKGSQLAVQGRIQVRSYETQDGSKRYATEVVANHVEFLGSKNDSQQAQKPPAKVATETGDDLDLSDFETMEDEGDLPF